LLYPIMEAEDQIINRVSSSSLITFDLETYYTPGDRIILDIKDQLYQGLILKEKDFRTFIKNQDWSSFKKKYVAITCSADAIVPTWAFMLVAIALEPFASRVVFGTLEDLEIELFRSALDKVDWHVYENAKVVIKGCSKVEVPTALYVDVIEKLKPVASSLMFGEACSTVPLYKKLPSKS
jgi:hypothetical protein